METFSQLGGLNASTLALGSNYGPLLLFFGLSSFTYWVTRRLHSCLAPALPAPLTQVLPPTYFLPPPLPPPPPQAHSRKTWRRSGSPTQSIPLNSWTGELPRPRWHWCLRRCVEGACGLGPLGCGVGWRGGAGCSDGGIYFWIWFQVYDSYDLLRLFTIAF